ncbi:MAG: alpha-galactosidase, partial [Pseudomonadota bacterium]
VEADPASDMIVLRARIHNIHQAEQVIDWIAAPVLPGPQAGDEILAFTGRWTGEFQLERHGWKAGAYVRESREGRTSHTDFPGLLMPVRGCTEVAGEAYGLHLGWSGGHRLVAEEMPCGRRQVQLGALVWPAHVIPGDGVYETPPLYATYSAEGLNGVSHAYHTYLRDNLLKYTHPERPRPVHYNCWEAVYFDHDLEVLLDLADRAAALGVERFVLDDGWFKGRNDDTSSLGDWEIDRVKWPDGLSPLIDHVNNLGMTFGIWFEPEMINEDSDLFRAHPEWAMDVAGPEGRQQRVMDITLPGVADYLFEKIDAVLAAYPIEYIKW